MFKGKPTIIIILGSLLCLLLTNSCKTKLHNNEKDNVLSEELQLINAESDSLFQIINHYPERTKIRLRAIEGRRVYNNYYAHMDSLKQLIVHRAGGVGEFGIVERKGDTKLTDTIMLQEKKGEALFFSMEKAMRTLGTVCYDTNRQNAIMVLLGGEENMREYALKTKLVFENLPIEKTLSIIEAYQSNAMYAKHKMYSGVIQEYAEGDTATVRIK